MWRMTAERIPVDAKRVIEIILKIFSHNIASTVPMVMKLRGSVDCCCYLNNS